ncbi:MAG: hypothetical protein ACE5GD_00940 [Candidatus Geothermarchaeales archaeon]
MRSGGHEDSGKIQAARVHSKALVAVTLGILVRLILMPYTSTPSVWARVTGFDNLFIGGLNPLTIQAVHGSSFWIFGTPFYALYTVLSSLGIHYAFLLDLLMKVPSLIGDLIIFYAIYRIAFLLYGDDRKSLVAASVYFLNPYVIWMAGIIGPGEQLMSGFLLLSILYLLEQRSVPSAICLGLATFFRYIPILFLPVFVGYLRRNRGSSQSFRFLKVYFVSSSFLLLPYLPILISLYGASGSALIGYIQNFMGPTEIGLVPYARFLPTLFDVTAFTYNFTGILATLGLYDVLFNFFSFKVFLIFFILATVFMFRRGFSSIQLINREVVVTFSLFMILIPLLQHHYLLWLLPFAVLSSYIFRDLPKYYPVALSMAFILIDPILPLSFLHYLDSTFPGLLVQYFGFLVFDSKLVALAISLLSALLLVLIVVKSLNSPLSGSRAAIGDDEPGLSGGFSISDWAFVLLLSLYGVFEMYAITQLRAPYSLEQAPVGLLISFYLVWKLWHRGGAGLRASGNGQKLFGGASLIVACAYLVSVAFFTLSVANATSSVPIFLLLELFFLGIFWLTNRASKFGLMVQRCLFIFTPVYVGFCMLGTGNLYAAYTALPLLISWLYIQIKSDGMHLKMGDAQSESHRPKRRALGGELIVNKMKAVLSRSANGRLLAGVSLAVLALTYSPLFIACANGAIPNERGFFPLPSAVFPGARQTQKDGGIVLGSLEGTKGAQAQWNSNTWLATLLAERMKEAIPARVVVVGDDPLSTVAPSFTPTKVGWRGNLSAIPWRVGGGEPLMEFNGGRLDLSANFTLGEKSTYLWWTPEGSLEIDSTEYPYVVARWRSTGHVARLCVYTATEEFKIIVETPTGVIEHPAWDYGGGYSPSWTTTVYRLPPNKTITRMDIGLDSGRWGDVDGEQHVEFDYIMFAQGTLDAPHVKVALNGETIFDKEIMSRIKVRHYTLSPNAFDVVSGELNPQGQQGERIKNMEIRIDGSQLVAENAITISLDAHSEWKIVGVLVALDVTSKDIEHPIWQSLIPLLWVILAGSAVLGLWACRRFYEWVKTT